ncbi:hypothetical protein RN616_11145 [Morganella morganii]|uniref:hypothetical protein n=1 Tax=Morganella morganii TaxID=582 RepID=UPI0028D602D2|nr:hypothetical protein [Morganella morganii]WNP29091.1 hypothetical protein RN616_11145 [Morganella morganii]
MKKNKANGREVYIRSYRKFILSLRRKSKKYFPVINTSEKYKKIKSPKSILKFVNSFCLLNKCKVDVNNFDGTLNIPKDFSFFYEPAKALTFIHKATKIMSEGKIKEMTLFYNRVREYCLGAECLLSMALTEARKINPYSDKRGVLINGIYPVNEQHLEIVRDIGIVSEIERDEFTEVTDNSDKGGKGKQIIFIKDSIEWENASVYANDTKNKTSEEFVKYINNCLMPYNLVLNSSAEDKLKSCMAELLDNAERHSGLSQKPLWYVRGYVNHMHEFPTCEMAIFNFGNTIPETFNYLNDSHFSFREQIQPYVNRHKKVRKMFKNGLVTVAALQERVSCKNKSASDSNGTGTMELLDLFQILHDSLRKLRDVEMKPVMSLVTGNTHIKFDGKFRIIKKKLRNGDGRKQYYPLNNTGLENPPDRNYIHNMGDVRFPGVMINIRFPLPSEVMEDVEMIKETQAG